MGERNMRRACNLVSPFVNNNSVAKIGRNLLYALTDMNADFAVLDMSDEYANLPTHKDIGLLKALNHTMISELSIERNIVFNASLSVMRKYSFPYDHVPYFSIWTRGVPREYLDLLVGKEKIFVYNNFTKEAICNQGIDEEFVTVIPPSIDSKLYKKAKKCNINGKKSFAFLSIVDTQSQNWTGVVRSFYDTFSAKDDVCLVIKANGEDYTNYHQINAARWIDSEKQKRGPDVADVILISESLSDAEMASLYASCDCYVKLSGVNSGISFIEAFASGLLCIGPEYGGSREILDRKTGFIVSKKTEQRVSNDTVLDGLTYDIYDEEHLSRIMRWVFDNSDTLKEKTVKERKIILSKFDRNIVGLKFLKSLRI